MFCCFGLQRVFSMRRRAGITKLGTCLRMINWKQHHGPQLPVINDSQLGFEKRLVVHSSTTPKCLSFRPETEVALSAWDDVLNSVESRWTFSEENVQLTDQALVLKFRRVFHCPFTVPQSSSVASPKMGGQNVWFKTNSTILFGIPPL